MRPLGGHGHRIGHTFPTRATRRALKRGHRQRDVVRELTESPTPEQLSDDAYMIDFNHGLAMEADYERMVEAERRDDALRLDSALEIGSTMAVHDALKRKRP